MKKNVKKMRTVFFITNTFNIGGAETQLLMLSEELINRGWSVTVFSFECVEGISSRFVSAGVRVFFGSYDSRTGRLRSVLGVFVSVVRLAWLLGLNRPRIVQGILPLPSLVASVVGKLLFLPKVIISRRALGTHQDRRWIWKYLDRLSSMAADVVVVNSNAVFKDVINREHLDERKIRLIYNGVYLEKVTVGSHREDVRSRLNISKNEIAIVYVANLIEYKGHADLLRAFLGVSKKLDFVRLILIGEDRGIMADLAAFVEQEKLNKKVLFLGQRKDVSEILTGMDVGVMASHEEGFSNALLEKLGAGLPIVATDVGGNREALDGLPSCYIVPPKAIPDLEIALLKVSEDVLRNENGSKVRQDSITKRFSVNAMVSSYERLFNERKK